MVLAALLLITSAADAAVDVKVPVDKLEIQLAPMSKEELTEAAKEWFEVLKAKATEVSRAQLDGAPIAGPRREQDAIVERFEAVLAALKEKGGDVGDYEKYVAAISGVDIDVKDAGALVTHVKDWIISPTGGVKWATKIVLFIITLIVFRIIANILGGITAKAASRTKQGSELLKDFLANMVRKITFFIGVIVALSMIDVNIGPFVAAIGAVGFIIGFALQGTLSNFASGIMILLYRPYDIGNFIDAAGVMGTVHAMSLVSTTLKTPDNQIVVIPNSSIWGGIITNVTGSDTRRVDLVFGIGYGDDIAKAKSVLENVMGGHELVMREPAPVVQLHELADSSVNFVARPWCKTSDYWQVYWDITRAVKERFDEEGISIPFPQRDIHVFQETAAS